jgi:hypothetical protein
MATPLFKTTAAYATLCLFVIACFRDTACSHLKVIVVECSVF